MIIVNQWSKVEPGLKVTGFDLSGCPGGIHALKFVGPTQDWLSFIIWDRPKTDQKNFLKSIPEVISAQTSETVLTSREMLLPEKSFICISVVYSDFLKSDPDWEGLVVRFQKQFSLNVAIGEIFHIHLVLYQIVNYDYGWMDGNITLLKRECCCCCFIIHLPLGWN